MHLQENSTRPKLPMPLQNEQATAAALRAQLEIELKNKKQCSYESYECTQLTLDGYDYCLKHILKDKNSPFKQCCYVYTSNGKRCHLPAPKGDKKDFGYCSEHALKVTLLKNKQNAKYPPPNTAEVLLHSLSHYIKRPRLRTSSSSTQYSDDVGPAILDDTFDFKTTKSLDPFTDVDASGIYTKQCNEVLDLCSESESDVEPSTFSLVWHDSQGDSSDDESDDSEQEDLLKHANVYTAEEITSVTQHKLVRLQSLYIEQYRHLQHMLKEKRRRYIHSLKREKETCCNIYNQVHDNPKEQRLYKKLKAYNNYHKVHGVEAILNKRLRDLRAKIVDGITPKSYSYTKCLFTEGGVKCGERTLPLARHCRKHILEDPNQILFVPCGKNKGDIKCNMPVEAIFDDSTCWIHMEIPPLQSYNQYRKDSESDLDDSAEMSTHFQLPFNEKVKTELADYNIPSHIPKIEILPTLLFEEMNDTTTDSAVESSIFGSTLNSNNISPSELNPNDIIENEPTTNSISDELNKINTISIEANVNNNLSDDPHSSDISCDRPNVFPETFINNICPNDKDLKNIYSKSNTSDVSNELDDLDIAINTREEIVEEVPDVTQRPSAIITENIFSAAEEISSSELTNVTSDLMEVNAITEKDLDHVSEGVFEKMEDDQSECFQNVENLNAKTDITEIKEP